MRPRGGVAPFGAFKDQPDRRLRDDGVMGRFSVRSHWKVVLLFAGRSLGPRQATSRPCKTRRRIVELPKVNGKMQDSDKDNAVCATMRERTLSANTLHSLWIKSLQKFWLWRQGPACNLYKSQVIAFNAYFICG
jgi:hypothetical protein